MRNILLLSLLCCCYTQGLKAQVYSCSYKIEADTAFIHYKESRSQMVNDLQTNVRKKYFDGTLFFCTVSKDKILKRVQSAFQQTGKYVTGETAIDTIMVNGSARVNKVNFSPDMEGQQFLIDSKAKIAYDIKVYPTRQVSCTYRNVYSYKVTTERKMIGNWYCTKWIPDDVSIAEKVSVWICDSISAAVRLDYITDQFPGGIVRIDFARGFSYKLVSYAKEGPDFVFPEVNCNTAAAGDSNFIKGCIEKNVAFDMKMDFDPQPKPK